MLLRRMIDAETEDGRIRARRTVGMNCLAVGMLLNAASSVWERLAPIASSGVDFGRGFLLGLGLTLMMVSIPLNVWRRR